MFPNRLLHVPPSYQFARRDGDYTLFALGNATHFFACTAGCHPQAISVVHDA